MRDLIHAVCILESDAIIRAVRDCVEANQVPTIENVKARLPSVVEIDAEDVAVAIEECGIL